MADATQFVFGFRELAELLVKRQGIHDGLWGVSVKFGLSAMNVSQDGQELRPAAIVPIMEIGIQRFNEASTLTVDAALVNPPAKIKGKGK